MKNNSGFTFVELVIVMGISMILFSIAATSFFTSGNRASLNSSVDVLLSDIKQQQLKTMLGYTTTPPTIYYYGIYFGTTSYTLFRGTTPTYNPNDGANIVINLGDNIRFSNITIPNLYVVFNKGNGNYLSYQNGLNTATLINNATRQSKTITFNKLGVISY